jgi:hypothetical protein
MMRKLLIILRVSKEKQIKEEPQEERRKKEVISIPYVDKETYDLIPRTTEITGSIECENKAYMHPIHVKERGETNNPTWMGQSNSVALKGTIGHHRIEEWLRDQFDFEPIKLEFTGGDKILYQRFLNDSNKLNWLKAEVDRSLSNFKDWYEIFEPEPVFLEKTMVYIHKDKNGKVDPRKSVKGTVDFIGSFDPNVFNDKTIRGSKGEMSAGDLLKLDEESIVIADWKTGVAKMPSYEAQIQAYHWTANKLNIWKDLPTWAKKLPRADMGSTILFGGKARKDGTINWERYMSVYEDISQYHLWLKAREIFFAPRPIITNHINEYRSDWREGYGCVFCTYRDNGCPIFYHTETSYELEVDMLKGGIDG